MVDPVQTVVDMIPMPEIQHPTIRIDPTRKMVRQAENSIESSTSPVPQRKIDRLDDAQSKLNWINRGNQAIKSAVNGTAETASKTALKGTLERNVVGNSVGSKPTPSLFGSFQNDNRPKADNARNVPLSPF